MSLRYLAGPVSADRADRFAAHRRQGLCLCFHSSPSTDLHFPPDLSWPDLLARLPDGWRPDFVLLDLSFTTAPTCLWGAPVPLVALAPDAQLQWSFLRLALPRASLVLADAPAVAVLHAAGIPQARPTNLFGLQGLFASPPPASGPIRDIDILFIGNLHHAVQRDRLPWLARLSRLASRWRVRIDQGIHGDDYRALLRRSRIVFNRSVRGEWNLRVAEACSSGALLFSESANREMPGTWQHGVNCVFYDDDTLESLLDHYLNHEDDRAAVAAAGRQTALDHTFDRHWQAAHDLIQSEWPAIQQHHAHRPPLSPSDLLHLRLWQAQGAADAADLSLPPALDAALSCSPLPASGEGEEPLPAALSPFRGGEESQASERGAGGVGFFPSPASLLTARALAHALAARDRHGCYPPAALVQFTDHLRQSLQADPSNLTAMLDLVEVLAAQGHTSLALSGARRLLASLHQPLTPDALLTPHFPLAYDDFRIEWERAAWANPGQPRREAEAKRSLLRWRLHALLARLTGDLAHHHEAVLARPDLPASRAALGCALAQRGRYAEALPHLHCAIDANPFDHAAARALYQALLDANLPAQARAFAQQRWLLHHAAPRHVPHEPWYVPFLASTASTLPPAGGPLLVRWQGAVLAQHSLGHVNRQLSRALAALDCGLTLSDVPSPAPLIPPGPMLDFVARHLDRPLARPADVTIRHAWPLDPTPPPEGRWVIFQPWEYGAIPAAWLAPMQAAAEVWAPSSFVRDGFIASGVPAGRAHVIPLGVDPDLFHPGHEPLPLPTSKRFKLLFVGGTIHRKGIDILLKACAAAFRSTDDVCLVIKDAGGGSFYRGQTRQDLIAAFRADAGNPELLHLDSDLSDTDMARLYCACDCLAAPYRGEGFGLPIAEAMACGLPVLVTAYGAALDFCDDSTAFLVPAAISPFPEPRVGDLPTIGLPHLAEPDPDALASLLRRLHDCPALLRSKTAAARQRILGGFTWQHAAALVQQRLQALARSPARQPAPPLPQALPQPVPPPRHDVRFPAAQRPQTTSLCIIARNEEHNIGACLSSAAGLFHETIVLDTGSTDRTREIARAHGARVFDFAWVDDFAAARNACLDHATGDFIFWLDADDRLDEPNRDRLRQLLSSLPDANVACSMKCLCRSAPGQPHTLVDHVRLFRRHPRIRWRYRIHEQILAAVRAAGGQVFFSDVVITHTGYADPALRQRKLLRDLRLLELSFAEQPHDPFILFNLGQTCAELRHFDRALALLRESLHRSHPSDSIVRKLYVLIANCHLGLGQPDLALSVCLDGQRVCPNDAELLFLEGILRADQADLPGAKAALVRLLSSDDGPHFASVVDGLRGHRGRHQLASVCLRLGEHAEAEALWRAVLRDQPAFRPAWLGLAELFLGTSRWPDLDDLLARLSADPAAEIDAVLLRARAHRARQEFAPARHLLEHAQQRWPDSLPVLLQYSYLLLQQDSDHALADSVLARILALDPGNSEALHNRRALHSRAGWAPGTAT